MTVQALFFDLDGTLLDSLEDIADAANHVLGLLGAEPHPLAAYRRMVGDGADILMQRAMPTSLGQRVEKAVELFTAYYTENSMRKTHLFEGVDRMLDAVSELSIPIAVVSNKPQAAAERVVADLLGAWPWVAVAGHRPDVPKKPDPASVLEIASRLAVDPGRCLFVGDSDTDMHTAVNAGMIGIGAEWGFRGRTELLASGATVICEHPSDVVEYLVSMKP